MGRLAFALLLAALAGAARAAPDVPDGAFASTASDRGTTRLEGRLLLDHDAVRPGETLRAGVLLSMSPHWHVYWRNSGQSGAPPRLRWQVERAEVGPVDWPFPQVFREADAFITTYGYTDEVLLASPVKFASGASGEVAVRVDADVLVCRVQCIPGELHLSRSVRVAAGGESLASADHALFEEWALRVPQPVGARELELEAMFSQSAIRPGDDFQAALAVHACSGGDGTRAACAAVEPATASAEDAFVPDPGAGLELLVTGARQPPSPGLLLTLKGHASPTVPAQESRLRGALAVRSGGRTEYVEVDLPLPRAVAGAAVTSIANPWLEPSPSPASFVAALPLWQALLLALLGGLVLNAMPCVLPVLAIKVFGLAELARHGRAGILRHGIAYTAGVLASMAALAAVVAALRAAGSSIGWGFQFQEPLFVAAIAAVLVVFALSLFGVFEFRLDVSRVASTGASAGGLRRSFFEGLLAVVLATPCTAPFLGTAVGFAFASSTATIAGIFLAIGAGLALPFLLICAVPSWARLVPRSGPWMVQLRTALGFALLGTVVWLGWILGRSAGSDAQALLLAYLCALAAGVWVFGVLQRGERVAAVRSAGVALVALALVGLRALPLDGPPPSEPPGKDELAGERYSASGVDAALARGAPVFVYFTAEWCLTCKVNEHVVLDDQRVRAALAQRGFEIFKGDWTRRDGAIRDELARFGKAGVPLYLVYGPKAAPQPIVLPELLTVDLFLKALHQAAPSTEEKT